MDKKIRLNGRHLFLVLLALVLAAGCASSLQATPIAGATVTATPDPRYSIHCLRNSYDNYLCYAGEKLLGDNPLMEKAASDFCAQMMGRCSAFIWKDEASVGQTYPLTDAETASLIAKFSWNPYLYAGCFRTYQDGETVHTSGNCGQ